MLLKRLKLVAGGECGSSAGDLWLMEVSRLKTRQIECPLDALEYLFDGLPQATRHRLFLSSESSELILDTSERISLCANKVLSCNWRTETRERHYT